MLNTRMDALQLRADMPLFTGPNWDYGSLRRTYGDVEPGQLLAYVGSDGSVEVAVRGGSAARLLGVGVGAEVRA